MNLRSMHSALLIFLFGMLTIVSCKKDIKNETENPTPGNPFAIPASTPVTGSVSGIVVDENNNPVSGAEVRLVSATTTTDSHGVFNFNNTTLDKYITTITVTNPGYFKAYRSFSANATRNYLNIKLIPKAIAGTINSANAEAVTLPNGSTLSFQANSMIVKSSGSLYTGSVNVFASYIDPTASDISASVPGSFMGSDGTSMYALQSTGMIAVELESSAGEALQIASGLPATMKLPIPSSLLNNAPATIDTWSLDENGVWKKEGTATKSGNYYEFQVSHFSFWNCDVPANAVYLTLHVQDQNGNPLVNTLVELTIPNNTTWWASTYGITDSLGNVSGLVPAAQSLEMNIYANPYSCPSSLNTQTIGPFTSNTTLTVTATIPAANVLTVTGTATNCSSSPLQNGTAIIYTSQNMFYYATIANGTYSATITHCDAIDSISVTVIDNASNGVGTSGTVTVSGNSVTVPAVNACGSTGAAVFTFGNSQGICNMGPLTGFFQAGVPTSGNDVIAVMVYITVPGPYNITTTTINGLTFSGAGVFTNTGQDWVYLTASGTPIAAGAYTFGTLANGITGCEFIISVGNAPPPQATFDLSLTCASAIVNGTYTAGTGLNSSNTITLMVTFTSPGSYSIYSNNVNGYSFADSGVVTAATTIPIVLTGYGAPQVAGTDLILLSPSNGSASCALSIVVQPNTSTADIIFDGAPGTCTMASVNGPYVAGSVLTGQSTVTIQVTVASPGTYSIATTTTNGMVFSGQGVFTTTGTQFVTLVASGTPASTGTYTFMPTGSGVTGCIFTVQVN